jgi:membrane-bound serine protease (ClpP class)
VFGAFGISFLAAGPVAAQGGGEDGVVDVVAISGLLDGIVADFIEDSIDRAEENGSLALVLQVNSTGSVISGERLAEVADRIASSDVPVSVWVGPSGSKAEGGVAQLAGVVDDLALAPGSKIGKLGDQILPEDRFGVLFGAAHDRLRDSTIGFEDAIELGMAREAPTLPFFVLDIDGFESEIDASGDEPVRVPVTAVRFAKLSLVDQLMHTVASPAVAYLLFVAGGALLVFELYTAGVGIAGVLGAGCFLLGCYGLDVLPARWWAVGLLVVAILGYAIDVQTGVPRAWSVIATASLVVGSLYLYEAMPISWVTLVAGIGGIALAMVAGMPAMVRTRFGTPTIGREWMIGEMGMARDDVAPEGVVIIQDAPWRARTNRATPISAGDAVRVVAIEGLWLEVEPPDGGAKDYRDRSRRR